MKFKILDRKTNEFLEEGCSLHIIESFAIRSDGEILKICEGIGCEYAEVEILDSEKYVACISPDLEE